MNNFEKETFDLLLSNYLKNYFANLKLTNKVDFDIKLKINKDNIPFNVYHEIYSFLLDKIKNSEYSDVYLSYIITDAYLYSFFDKNDNNSTIKEQIKDKDITELGYYIANNTLFGTALIKAFVNYLLLISEDASYKDLLLEEAKKTDGEEFIKKFYMSDNIVLSRNEILRGMILDLYDLLNEQNYSKEQIYTAFDNYFENGTLPDSLFKEYNYLYKNPDEYIRIQGEQMRLIYESVYVCLIKGNVIVDNENKEVLSYITDAIKDNDLRLPPEKQYRWEFYEVFLTECDYFNLGKDITSLDQNHHHVLKKINPYYFLDTMEN